MMGITVLCLLTLFTQPAKAVTTVNARFADNPLPSLPTDIRIVHSINTDMQEIVQGTNRTQLVATAIDYTDISFTRRSYVIIQSDGFNAFTPMACSLSFVANNIDIAIANNLNPLNNYEHDFIIHIVFEDGTGNIFHDFVELNNVGLTTTFTTPSFSGGFPLNTTGSGTCSNPHIDMSADALFTTYGGSYYPLHHYAIVWEQDFAMFQPQGIYGLVGFWGSNGTATQYYNGAVTPIILADVSHPDVACLGYITPPVLPATASRNIYVSCISNGNGDVLKVEFEADKTINIVGGFSTVTVAPGFSFSEWHYNPRIECIVAADLPGFAQEIWQIVCESDPGSGNREIRAYNNMTPLFTPAAVYDLGTVATFTGNHAKPVVSGVGEGCHPGATNIYSHNKHFTTSYYTEHTNMGLNGGFNEGDYFANAIYQPTGYPAPFGPYPDYYEINNNVLQSSFVNKLNEPVIATTSCSNTGHELFSVWYEGWDGGGIGTVNYKFNGDTYSYKNGTTGVANVNKEKDYNIYPSPATTTLHVQGADNTAYSIVDAIGKTVASGTVTAGANTIAVNQLAAGTYIIQLTENGYTQQARFVKQ